MSKSRQQKIKSSTTKLMPKQNSQIVSKQEDIKKKFKIGLEAHKKEDYETAINYYQQVMKLKPNHLHAYNNLAVIYQIQEKQDEALQLFQQTLKINSNYVAGYNNIANIYH